MTQEEKAKAYDEALERMKSWAKGEHPECFTEAQKAAEFIFPELAESEDERISREITEFILTHRIDEPNDIEDTNLWLAWLEKQGEQKPADKVEPKFYRGEWIVHHGTENIYKVIAIVGNQYQLRYGDNYTIQKCADVDRCARLWDITKDAKDGDVLASGEVVFIFKTIHGVWLNCHCSAHKDGSFIADSYDLLTNRYFSEVFPATKEQRDLLFQKMKEAGYEWDETKKKLKKIEDEE